MPEKGLKFRDWLSFLFSYPFYFFAMTSYSNNNDTTHTSNSAYDGLNASNRLVSESCMDLFLIEMVDTICRTTTAETDGDSDAIFYKLETLGYAVGQRLVERFTKDRPRFVDTLDVVKFICKDLWTIMFKKQIDNLKTNHRVSVQIDVGRKSVWLMHTTRACMFCKTMDFGGLCACRQM